MSALDEAAARDAAARARLNDRPAARPLYRLSSSLAPTRRQIEVLESVAVGHTNPEIAARLDISLETVKQHIKNLLLRLNASNRAHAVAIGYQLGLLSL